MKISVIISSYNRYELLLRAIESVLNQTFSVYEIIVINDCSSDPRYYNLKMDKTKFIHLEKNSRHIFGFPSAGYVRDIGIRNSVGDYIAILDDDDLFLPKKIETQLREMQKMKYLICSSEAYLFNEKYFKENSYPIYHREFYNDFCKSFFGKNYSSMLPEVFNYQLIASHNFIIHSTVIFTRELYFEVGGYESVINGMEDWNLFKKMLKLYPCLHINSPLIYYSYIDRS